LPWGRRVNGHYQVDALLAEGRLATLTEGYAPVDQMLAPVFHHEASR
jgi:hypothetical protein